MRSQGQRGDESSGAELQVCHLRNEEYLPYSVTRFFLSFRFALRSKMRKQLDPRIPILISNNVKKNNRSFIVLVGDKGRDQVRSSTVSIPMSCSYGLAIDREPPLSTFSSEDCCPPVRTLVLQEGTWIHNVSLSNLSISFVSTAHLCSHLLPVH